MSDLNCIDSEQMSLNVWFPLNMNLILRIVLNKIEGIFLNLIERILFLGMKA